MDVQVLKSFFMWCTIINFGLLLLSFFFCTVARGLVYKMHSWFFPMSREEFNVSLYRMYGAYKMLVFVFNFVPYIALLIVA